MQQSMVVSKGAEEGLRSVGRVESALPRAQRGTKSNKLKRRGGAVMLNGEGDAVRQRAVSCEAASSEHFDPAPPHRHSGDSANTADVASDVG